MGTKERLAEALNTPLAHLEDYLRKGEVPDRIFFKALDIVATAPPRTKK